MTTLQAGFSRVNITPMMGIDIAGYYKIRKAEGVLDDLELNALALSCGDTKVVMITIDNCGIKKAVLDTVRTRVAEQVQLPLNAITISATHTHTGPTIQPNATDPLELEYLEFVTKRAVDVVTFALDDLKPAAMGWGIGQAPRVAFVRRFRMKDGSVQTNPGVNNPNILAPIGDVDERVNVVRFRRENADDIVMVNFGNHPDVVGGNKISGDWPSFLRKTVEKAIDNTKCIFFNGAQGDVNHVNVFPKGGEMNDMFHDFDDVARGYAHARHIGHVVAGGVLQVYDKVKFVNVDSIRFAEKIVKVPSNRAAAEELPEAHRINDLHNAGRDNELPYEGMMLTTVVARAARMVALENGPDFFELPLAGIAIGPVAFVGIPGEPFTGIGRALKETEGFDLIMPACLTNGSEGYYPMQEAYDEGGYEAGSSRFKAGVAELLIEGGKSMLKELEK